MSVQSHTIEAFIDLLLFINLRFYTYYDFSFKYINIKCLAYINIKCLAPKMIGP